MLGTRTLDVCSVVYQPVKKGNTPFKAMRDFCALMCPKPLLPKQPVYGFNDWYCDYGNNTAESVAEYARFVVRLSPKGGNRPYMVIDDGWQPPGPASGGPWNIGNEKFPSMPELAKEIEAIGAKPGIWVRLLTAQKYQAGSWRLRDEQSTTLDPSKPEVRAYIVTTVRNIRSWGYKLIKHDFSTFDIFKEWDQIIPKDAATWSFSDRSRTSAEIVTDFYRAVREGAGDAVIIGCNTLSHLSAGIFEVNRTGDDTSGKDSHRLTKMGVNTMAFRIAHEGTFYSADADCVGLTEKEAIPWALTCQWLQLLSQSGTPLFISFKKGSVTPEQEKVIAAALEVASQPQPLAEPLDWFTELMPKRWVLRGKTVEFDWSK
jgi:alpha-galactosidase